mgnify:CR=1 FL=1
MLRLKVLFFLVLWSVCVSYAQTRQLLKLKNGSEIKCNVLIVTSDSIKIQSADGSVWVFNSEEIESLITLKETTKSSKSSLPKISYGKVRMPNGKKRRRYYGGGLYMKEREFYDFLKTNCPEAYNLQHSAHTWNAVAWATVWFVWPMGIVGDCMAMHKSDQALLVYNRECATAK